MKHLSPFRILFAILPLCVLPNSASAYSMNMISTNAGFEGNLSAPNQPAGWDSVWAREPGLVIGAVDSKAFHTGYESYRIDSSSTQDWSFGYSTLVGVLPNELINIEAWVKCRDCDDAEISVVERGSDGSVIDWQHGTTQIHGTLGWTDLTNKFIVDQGCTQVQFRLTGKGKGTVWLDDVSLTEQVLPGLQSESSSTEILLSNPAISLTLNPNTNYAMQVTLGAAPSSPQWSQIANSNVIILDGHQIDGQTAKIDFVDRATASQYQCFIHLDPSLPEIRVRVIGDANSVQQNDLEYPTAFATGMDVDLDIPANEGILYWANDHIVKTYALPLFAGQSMSMSWFGQYSRTSGAGVMTIVETPDDATLNFERDPASGFLFDQLAWNPCKGTFGYDRVVNFVFFSSGGYVAHTKRYRAYAEKVGLVRTLAQKRLANPNVDKLIGAADIWDWDTTNVIDEPTQWKAEGLDRVLWSNEEAPDVVDKINALGYLSGRYDLYQDEYSPDAPAYLEKSPDWPSDLIIDKYGQYVRCWVHYETGADGKKVGYDANAGCSLETIKRAHHDIPLDLSTHHYTARFIDTITASQWNECYSPVHPTTRTQDKFAKMQILNYVANTEHMVTGSETGNEAAVPYEDYFEGMESISQYRLPNAGYNAGVYQPPTPEFMRYQIGVGYRVPLFELVYHDCMVSTWYWGDASNQEPEVWRQRDLWNILYGTNPIYVLDANSWAKTKTRLLQSYNDVSHADRLVGYAQMVDHTFLTSDKTVQETSWSNGIVILVNFGDNAFQTGTETVPSNGYLILSPTVSPIKQ
jgi:hypothetical protein